MINRNNIGFTIVELLVVIVVIAVLASIVTISYRNVQTSAKNAQTHQALSSWVRAINAYRVEHGGWPPEVACLGVGYKYGPDAEDAGTGQCRQQGAFVSDENEIFNQAMSQYFSGTFPTPAFVTAKLSETEWVRGIHYLFSASNPNVYIMASYAGELATCPEVKSKGITRTIWNGNTRCTYLLGAPTDS